MAAFPKSDVLVRFVVLAVTVNVDSAASDMHAPSSSQANGLPDLPRLFLWRIYTVLQFEEFQNIGI
jgi:hypothetical protein